MGDPARITEPMFTVDWYFGGTMGGTDVASIEEIANEDAEMLTRAALAFAAEEDKKRSLAEVYGVLRQGDGLGGRTRGTG